MAKKRRSNFQRTFKIVKISIKNNTEKMKDFLLKLVSFIISEDTKVEILEEDQDGVSTYTIVVPESEIGKIIGKGGKVISSLRTICRLKAIKDQQRIFIKAIASSV